MRVADGDLPASYLAEFGEPAGYLDFASIGPVSARVVAATRKAWEWLHAPPGSPVPIVMEEYEAAKAVIARFLTVPAEDVTIIPSTSAGLFQVAFGLTGGNVVVAAHEFPANVYPWLRAAGRGGPEVRLVEVPDLRVTPSALADAVDDETAAVSVSLVDFRSGFRVDVGSLNELAGDALLVVDAIQGLGAVDFPAAAADVVVCGGQKWLRAGWGAGFMTAGPRARERLAPTLTGWYGVEGFLETQVPAPHEPRAGAERYQEGSPVVFGAVAAAAAVEVVAEAGIDVVERRILDLAPALEEVVRAAGAEVLAPWREDGERAGILSFRLPHEDSAATAERLRTAGLALSERAGWLRVAPHASTSDEAVTMLAGAL